MFANKLTALVSAVLLAAVASTPLDDYVWAEGEADWVNIGAKNSALMLLLSRCVDPHYSWNDTGIVLSGKSMRHDTAWTGKALIAWRQ